MVTPPKYEGYVQALTGGAFYCLDEPGMILLKGADRVDFLQRQTTNDVRLLSADRAVVTVLTTPTARILDVLLLVQELDAISIVTVPGHGASTYRFLKSKIFFMDKVAVSDVSADYVQFDLYGRELHRLLEKAELNIPIVNQVTFSELSGIAIKMIGYSGLPEQGVRLIAPAADSRNVEGALADIGLTRLSAEGFDILRIESGGPGLAELSEDFSPLEVNIRDAISDSKGCYTGQEIIARQISFDKVTRSLVGLCLSSEVERGASIMHEGRTMGNITSVGHSPEFGWIGLAVLKRPANDAGTVVTIVGEDAEMTGTVVSLPFRK